MATTSTADSKPVYITRSGRISRPPAKLAQELAVERMEDDYDTDEHDSSFSDGSEVTSIATEEEREDDAGSLDSFIEDDESSDALSE